MGPTEDDPCGVPFGVADAEEVGLLIALLAANDNVALDAVLLTRHRDELRAAEEPKLEKAPLGLEHPPAGERLTGTHSGAAHDPSYQLLAGTAEAADDHISNPHERPWFDAKDRHSLSQL